MKSAFERELTKEIDVCGHIAALRGGGLRNEGEV